MCGARPTEKGCHGLRRARYERPHRTYRVLYLHNAGRGGGGVGRAKPMTRTWSGWAIQPRSSDPPSRPPPVSPRTAARAGRGHGERGTLTRANSATPSPPPPTPLGARKTGNQPQHCNQRRARADRQPSGRRRGTASTPRRRRPTPPRLWHPAHRPALQRGETPPHNRISSTPRPNASEHSTVERRRSLAELGTRRRPGTMSRRCGLQLVTRERGPAGHAVPPHAAGLRVEGVPLPIITHPFRLTLGVTSRGRRGKGEPSSRRAGHAPRPIRWTPPSTHYHHRLRDHRTPRPRGDGGWPGERRGNHLRRWR